MNATACCNPDASSKALRLAAGHAFPRINEYLASDGNATHGSNATHGGIKTPPLKLRKLRCMAMPNMDESPFDASCWFAVGLEKQAIHATTVIKRCRITEETSHS